MNILIDQLAASQNVMRRAYHTRAPKLLEIINVGVSWAMGMA
jgi:hypothetical protein